MTSVLRRRVFLRLIGATAAASAVGCAGEEVVHPVNPTFFTADERSDLAALADLVIPPDKDPGAAALGAVDYIEQLLTSLSHDDGPHVYASGPYSGRQPFPASDGGRSTDFPPDSFTSWVPLDRYSLASFKLYLFGSDAFVGGAPNDKALGKTVGLRDQMRTILAAARDSAGKPLSEVAPEDLTGVWNSLDTGYQATLLELIVEGCFSPPEYGGNKDLAGYRIANFPGDIMPYGYSYFDASTGKYLERSEMPVSTIDPGADPDPFDDDTRGKLELLIGFLGGKKFT